MKAGLALGGNLGDTQSLLQTAADLLNQHPRVQVLKTSRSFSTTPMGASAGDRFVNGALLVETELSAEELLELCQHIEQESGRVRQTHWGPRTLDLDIIFFGDEIIETERLQVPHRACWYRRFVLDPLCDVAGEFRHPVFGLTFHELQIRLVRRPFVVDLSQLEDQRQQSLLSVLSRYPSVSEARPGQSATLVLLDRPMETRSEQRPGEVYEQDLPGPFERYLQDMLDAALDSPTPLQ